MGYGSPAYVFRAWRPSDIKDIAECLPDPSAVGGESLATASLEMAHHPSANHAKSNWAYVGVVFKATFPGETKLI